jgi:hypothetical protein
MKISSRCMAAPWLVFLLLILASALRAATSGQSSTLSNGKNSDGPAELPSEYAKSSIKDTTAGGKTWMVRSGQSLEQVFASASCGDTIQLQAGATFSGNFVMPAKNCDDSH